MRGDWAKVLYKLVVEVISGKSQKEVESSDGQYPIYGSGGPIGLAKEYRCEPGTTIIGRKGTINSPIYVTERFWNIDTAFGLYPSTAVLQKFNYFFCEYFNFKKLDKSTAVPSLAKRDIQAINFLLPPFPEQRAIVAKIEELFSSLDNGIANLEKAQEQLKVYRQAVLKKAFEGELTKEWREKQTDLPSAEELLEQIKRERENYYEQQLADWKVKVAKWEENGKEGKKPGKPKKLSQIKSVINSRQLVLSIDSISLHIVDCLHSTAKFVEQGYYCVDTTCIVNTQILWDKIRFVDKVTFQDRIRRLKPRQGDILFAREGTIGTTLVLKNDVDICLGQRMMMFRSVKQINPYFQMYFFISNEFKKQYKPKIGGTTAPHLNIRDVKEFQIPVLPYKEQSQIIQEIESRLSVCDKVEESIKEGLQKAKALKQSILKKAFDGALLTEVELEACRKEADWEPAEVLLERIKAEKK